MCLCVVFDYMWWCMDCDLFGVVVVVLCLCLCVVVCFGVIYYVMLHGVCVCGLFVFA